MKAPLASIPSSRRVDAREVRRIRDSSGAGEPESDLVVVEEPLEIRINSRPMAVIMRTPGEDVALARGFLLTEGIVHQPSQIARVLADAGEAEHPQNVVAAELVLDAPFNPEEHARQFYATSSCGICGKSSLEAVRLKARPVIAKWKVSGSILLTMPAVMRKHQKAFDQTGALHAAALFDPEGELIDVAEDVGRHNAVDKVIGRAAEEGTWPLERRTLFVSGRMSFEIVQKALMAGIAVIGGVSGTSSLAIDLAEEHGLTLAGFVRGESMTIYAGAWRIE